MLPQEDRKKGNKKPFSLSNPAELTSNYPFPSVNNDMDIHDVLQAIIACEQMEPGRRTARSSRIAKSCLPDNSFDLKCLIENAQISKDLIQSQPSKPYRHYLAEFLKSMKVRDSILNGMHYTNGRKTTGRFTLETLGHSFHN